MPECETYRAVIREPHKAPPEPDRYGTLTIPGSMTTFTPNVACAVEWARKVLPSCQPGAFCEIFKVEEVYVDRVLRSTLVDE